MHWLGAVERLREEREAGVLVTLAEVRGHAPRDAGAKLVVSADQTWGSVGGGNLEELAVRRARVLLRGLALTGGTTPVTERHILSDKGPAEHGVQCCGGEVTVLLEPLPVRPAVAVFGMGHDGYELALLLSRHELELHLVDSRRDQLIRLTAQRSIPAIYHIREFPLGGGLISYGANLVEAYYQMGVLVGRVLKGAAIADLPVARPTKFELAINLGAAKKLGLTIPSGVLAIADELVD